jgi:hypothetical protein
MLSGGFVLFKYCIPLVNSLPWKDISPDLGAHIHHQIIQNPVKSYHSISGDSLFEFAKKSKCPMSFEMILIYMNPHKLGCMKSWPHGTFISSSSGLTLIWAAKLGPTSITMVLPQSVASYTNSDLHSIAAETEFQDKKFLG